MTNIMSREHHFNFLTRGAQQKGHKYLRKPAARSCKIPQVCVTFYWTPGVKKLSFFSVECEENENKNNRQN